MTRLQKTLIVGAVSLYPAIATLDSILYTFTGLSIFYLPPNAPLAPILRATITIGLSFLAAMLFVAIKPTKDAP